MQMVFNNTKYKAHRLLILWALLVGVATAPVDSQAQRVADSVDNQIQVIKSFLASPEDKIDLAKLRVTVDKMIDPSIDEAATLKALDQIASQVRAMIRPNASSREKFEALRSFLYQPGPWNQGQIYKYDLENDPLGTAIRGKLMSNYLATKLGNCVSMPALFVIIGRKIGIDVTLSLAPEHNFVKFRDESGAYINAETTHDGGVKADASYVREYKITKAALSNGLYLRPLSTIETAVQMTSHLSEYYSQQRDVKRLHATTDYLLSVSHRHAEFMVRKGSAYGLDIKNEFASKYPTPSDIPPTERAKYDRLAALNESWCAEAEALGWVQPTDEVRRAQETFARNAAKEQKAKGL